MKNKSKTVRRASVWSDIVDVNGLKWAVVLGSVIGLGFYFLGYFILNKYVKALDPQLIKGYSMILGVLGCILAGIISSILFKPQRILEETSPTKKDLIEVLDEYGIKFEEEIQALEELSPREKIELKESELFAEVLKFNDM